MQHSKLELKVSDLYLVVNILKIATHHSNLQLVLLQEVTIIASTSCGFLFHPVDPSSESMSTSGQLAVVSLYTDLGKGSLLKKN